jgi:hypothetical protein
MQKNLQNNKVVDPVPNPDYYPVYPDDPGYFKEAGQPFGNH